MINYVFDLKDTAMTMKHIINDKCPYKCNNDYYSHNEFTKGRNSTKMDSTTVDLKVEKGKGWKDEDMQLFKINKKKWFKCGITEYRYHHSNIYILFIND